MNADDGDTKWEGLFLEAFQEMGGYIPDEKLLEYVTKADAMGCVDPDSFAGKKLAMIRGWLHDRVEVDRYRRADLRRGVDKNAETQRAIAPSGNGFFGTTSGQGTAAQLDLQAERAYVKKAAGALRGNIASSLMFAVTGNADLAAAVGGMFDLAGGMAGGKVDPGYQLKVHGTRFPNAGPLGQPGSPGATSGIRRCSTRATDRCSPTR